MKLALALGGIVGSIFVAMLAYTLWADDIHQEFVEGECLPAVPRDGDVTRGRVRYTPVGCMIYRTTYSLAQNVFGITPLIQKTGELRERAVSAGPPAKSERGLN